MSMRFNKTALNGHVVSIGTGNSGTEITETEYNNLLEIIRNKPKAESGYDYLLKEDLTWELYALPEAPEEQTTHTVEQLEGMSNSELKEICSELGISETMTKTNMINLIISKQAQA